MSVGPTPRLMSRSWRLTALRLSHDKNQRNDDCKNQRQHAKQLNERHHDGLLMAYLPKQKVVIQADAFHPRPGAKPYPTPPQFTVNFYENIQRLKLDVAQVLHIHGGTDSIATVAKAAGRS